MSTFHRTFILGAAVLFSLILFFTFNSDSNPEEAAMLSDSNGRLTLVRNTADASTVSSESSVIEGVNTDVIQSATSSSDLSPTQSTSSVKETTTTPPQPAATIQKESLPKPAAPTLPKAKVVATPPPPVTPAPQKSKIEIPPAPAPIHFSTTEMLKEHNTVRKNTGVPTLTWSNTLAASAQKWSETLKSESCKMRHDPNSQLGENIYMIWTTAVPDEGLVSSPKKVVTAWAAEKAFYDYATNSCLPGKKCGHYTQLVWANTTQVGCGVSVCAEEGKQTDIWVCRYSPHGNIVGLQPF